MATLAEFYALHGTAGTTELANTAQTKLSYIRQLIWVPKKRPSADMAVRLVDASNALPYATKLTLDDLINPNETQRKPRRLAEAA
jgi:hypothetical protein